MDAQEYLARLSYKGPLAPDLATLRALHLAHLRRVPFENLDIHLGRLITIDLGRFFDKVVTARRGGFCYELNGVFGWLLRELEFRVTYHSARVIRPDQSYGPEFDHLVLVVRTADSSGPRWLADVGFGESFLEPLPLIPGQIHQQCGRSYRLDAHDGQFRLLRCDDQGRWQAEFAFTLEERSLRDFEAMCDYHQRSPESSFTQRRIASIATDEGRTTLADFRLITTRDGVKLERPITDASDYASVLSSHFGIELSGADVRRLTRRCR